MVSLEQVKLLESKVTKAIDYVQKVTEENTSLKGKLDSYQKRIDELEVLIQQFKEEQGRIEDGILSALDRLNQFEDAFERTLTAGDTAPVAPESPTADKLPTNDTPPPKKDNSSAKKEKEAPASTLEPEPAEARPSRASPQENIAENDSDDSKSSEELDIF